jgi:hypothetical protein
MDTSVKQFDDELHEFIRESGSGAKYPPNCFVSMKAEVVHYESRSALTVR